MQIIIAIIIIILSISTPDISSGEDIHINSVSLSAEENAALKQLNSVFNHDTGVMTLQRSSPDADQMHDATMMVMDIRKRWNEWSPEFREIASQYFLSKPSLVNNPSRPRTLMRSGNTVRGTHLLPNWVETAHFNIEWGNNLLKGDSGSDSDKVVSCSAAFNNGSACSGIPDFIDRWADYLEEVWAYETVQLGYSPPAGTDMYLYDVYIANTRDNITGNGDDLAPSLGYNYLGLTVTYCDKNYSQICKDDISPESYSYIILNNVYPDDLTMKISAAHEFFHAIQFSYPSIDEWWLTPEDHWWIEATATWMEEVVYDESNHYYSRVRLWLRSPELSLKNTGTSYSGHVYGDVIFILYLTDVYMKNREFVRDVWASDESGIAAINNVLAADKYGNTDFESAFRGFVALNAVADIGEAYGGYEEGKQYGRAAATEHYVYPVISSVSSSSAPHELGSNYIQFLPPDNDDNRLIVEFDGTDGINWAAMLVKVRSDGTGFETDDMETDPSFKTGCHSVDGFGSVYSEVFLVASVFIEPTLMETAPYSYKASLDGVCPDTANQAISVALVSETDPEINKGSDKRCFIATAAFGSSDSPYVQILRDFRDSYLMDSVYGRVLVTVYYSVSPSIADFIENHPPAGAVVRYALFPLIGITFLLLNTSMTAMIVVTIVLLYTCRVVARHAFK